MVTKKKKKKSYKASANLKSMDPVPFLFMAWNFWHFQLWNKKCFLTKLYMIQSGPNFTRLIRVLAILLFKLTSYWWNFRGHILGGLNNYTFKCLSLVVSMWTVFFRCNFCVWQIVLVIILFKLYLHSTFLNSITKTFTKIKYSLGYYKKINISNISKGFCREEKF